MLFDPRNLPERIHVYSLSDKCGFDNKTVLLSGAIGVKNVF